VVGVEFGVDARRALHASTEHRFDILFSDAVPTKVSRRSVAKL